MFQDRTNFRRQIDANLIRAAHAAPLSARRLRLLRARGIHVRALERARSGNDRRNRTAEAEKGGREELGPG